MTITRQVAERSTCLRATSPTLSLASDSNRKQVRVDDASARGNRGLETTNIFSAVATGALNRTHGL